MIFELVQFLEREKLITDLKKAEHEINKVLAGENSDELEILYQNRGNIGGNSPKCLVNINGKSWLVKFWRENDPKNIEELEYNI